MSSANITTATTRSSTYAYRHYYAKLDFEARAPPASALPLPKWFRQSSSASPSSGIEPGHSRDDDKSAQDIAEGDTERPDRESEVKCTPATSSVTKGDAHDNPLEVRKRQRAETRETQQAHFQQWAEHQIDTALKDQIPGDREAIASHVRQDHVRDLALRQAQKLSALWVRNQMMGQRLAAKLRRDTVKLAQREAMEITKGEGEGEVYRSAS